MHPISSDLRSQAALGLVSTWMGERLGIAGAVGLKEKLLDGKTRLNQKAGRVLTCNLSPRKAEEPWQAEGQQRLQSKTVSK